MLKKYIVFNAFILFGFVSSDDSKVCQFNKYMLYYMKTKDAYFDRTFLCQPYSYGNLEEYEEDLRSVGNVVLRMVNYLSLRGHDFEKSPGLLNLNLYLNNIFETLMLRTYDGLNSNIYTGTDEKYILLLEFKKANNKLVESLSRSIKNDCLVNNSNISTPTIFLREPLENFDDLNNLLPESWNLDATKCVFDKSALDTFNALDQSVIDLNFLSSEYWTTYEYEYNANLKPKNILFYDLLSNRNHETSLYILRSITLTEKLVDNNVAANMTILFDMMQRVFDTTCLKSFHQQVLVAIVHPIYSCIGSYVQIVKKIFYDGQEEKYADVDARAEDYERLINAKGHLIIKAFEKLLELNIYTGNGYYHLMATQREFRQFVDFPNKKHLQTMKPKWIDRIYNRCSNAMSHSLLKFDNHVDSIEIKNKEDFEEMVMKLGRIIVEVENYVEAIRLIDIKREEPFNFFSQDYIFQREIQCNIVKNNKNGYHLLLNKKSTFKRSQPV